MNNILLILLALLVMVSASHAQPAFEHRSLEEALNPDGTLKRGVQGSFKVDGYQMRTGANGEPIFLPQTQNTATGTWDTQFGLPGPGVAGVVNALAFDGQGNVYVGGVFGAVGGVSTAVNYIARYNVQTNSWSTLGTDTSNGVRVGNGVSLGIVNALAIDRQGRLYVGGTFLQAGGVSANGVARFDPATNTWSALGTGTQIGERGAGAVRALAVDGQGRVYVGGDFTQAGGVSANRVARFDPQANSWSALGTGAQNGVNGTVNALAVDGQGRLYVGGSFASAGGVSANRVARFDPQANSWSTLGTGSSNGLSDIISAVYALAVDGQGRVYVGGDFTQAGGVSANNVARFDPQANSWSALGTGSGNGVNRAVGALAVDGSGRVYVGGTFLQAGGVSANAVARFDPQANSWSTLGTGTQNGVSFNFGQLAFSGIVNALAVDGQGRVYVGGLFTQAGGVSANNVARFDPQANSWSALGTGAQNGVNSTVYALAIDGSGRVYVGGLFTQAGGVSANNVARFDPATNSWSTLGTGAQNGVNSTVYALAIDGSGRVYVGGSFTQAGGVSANRVARFDPQANSWSALGTGAQNGVSGEVRAFAIDGSGRVYVGGFFIQAGSIISNQVTRFDPQANSWSALGSSTGVNGVNSLVQALAVDGQGRLYVGGFFASAGGVPSTFIARWTSGASRVEQISTNVPRTFLLEQNYPNPFNPSTTIRYQLPVASEVKLEVYDVLGKKVATLVNERQAAGYYQYVWNANGLSSGVYLYRLQAGRFIETKKMMLVK